MMEVEEERRFTSEANPVSGDDPAQLVVRLAAEALESLLVTLTAHGNKVSTTHQQAVRELLDDLAAQALGLKPGRRAYALPCGAGKTLSVVALIAASRKLCLPITFAVATSQIAALGRLRRDLVHAGVLPADIALRHSKSASELLQLAADAEDSGLPEHLADTADADCPILLLSHSRVRGACDRRLLRHRGAARSLVIWDESLFVADAETLTIQEVRGACDLVLPRIPAQSLARSYLATVSDEIDREVARQRAGGTPIPLALLPQVDDEQLAFARAAIPSFGSAFAREAGRTARRLLGMSRFPLSVALTRAGASGEGLIRYSVVVPTDLTNIAILDASHQVRLLAKSPCITDGTTEAMRDCKRYDHVQVNEFSMSTGKSTLSDSHAHRDRLALQVARQVLLIPSDEPILIFTSKGDESKSLQRELKDLVGQHGADLGELLADGKPRISWLTWGSETSLNTFSHCKHVILCGVVRRNPLELAASAAGRQDDLSFRMSGDEQRQLQLSEMCHSVLQALSRGSCRISDAHGQAKAMTLTIYGTFPGMREMLAPSLPGIRWHAERLAQAESRTGTAARRILAHLDGLPTTTTRVSVSLLKKSMELGVGRDALTTAVKDAAVLSSIPVRIGAKWRHEGRSLVRVE